MADLQDMSIRSVVLACNLLLFESVMADHILIYATDPLAGRPSCNYCCVILFLRSVLCAETRSLVNTQQQALVVSACRQPFTCGNRLHVASIKSQQLSLPQLMVLTLLLTIHDSVITSDTQPR